MNLTNRLELPEPLVRAVSNDDYVRGDADLTVTELIAPPRQVELLRQHRDAISEDAADRIFLLMGKLIHSLLAQSGQASLPLVDAPVRIEERLSMPIGGWTVSGQFDHFELYPSGRLDDWKLTSVWTVKDGIKEEWEAQLNCYAHLLRHHGHDVSALQAVVIYRDWSKPKAAREPDYPQEQVQRLPAELWHPDETQAFMEASVLCHQEARERLPLCTADERWERPTKWAVMKNGNKRAVKLHDDVEAAVAHTHMLGASKHFVEKRPGEAVRCEHYCLARSVCTQANGLQS